MDNPMRPLTLTNKQRTRVEVGWHPSSIGAFCLSSDGSMWDTIKWQVKVTLLEITWGDGYVVLRKSLAML